MVQLEHAEHTKVHESNTKCNVYVSLQYNYKDNIELQTWDLLIYSGQPDWGPDTTHLHLFTLEEHLWQTSKLYAKLVMSWSPQMSDHMHFQSQNIKYFQQ